MSDSFSQALSAVTEALSNPPSPENIKIETAMQLLGAMDKLRAMLEPPNLAVVKLCTAVRKHKTGRKAELCVDDLTLLSAIRTQLHTSRPGDGCFQCVPWCGW